MPVLKQQNSDIAQYIRTSTFNETQLTSDITSKVRIELAGSLRKRMFREKNAGKWKPFGFVLR